MGKNFETQRLDRWEIWSLLTDAFEINQKVSMAFSELVSDASNKDFTFSHDWCKQFVNAGILQPTEKSRSIHMKYTLAKRCPIPYDDSLDKLPSILSRDISLISREKKKTLAEMSSVAVTVKPKDDPIPPHLAPKTIYDKVDNILNDILSLKKENADLRAEVEYLKRDINKQRAIMSAAKELIKAIIA